MPGPSVLEYWDASRETLLDQLRRWVEHESPSLQAEALNGLASKIADRLRAIGASVDRVPNPTGDHLKARFAGSEPNAAPALILGHFDTVWPLGTLRTMPFRIEGNRAYGPGIFDMKGGLMIALAALEALSRLGFQPPRPIELLLTADEEIGSPSSRGLIEETAARAAYTLVPEPPLPGGVIKTARKGVGRYTLEVEGRAAHSGIEPQAGRSAVVELAHQILAIDELKDYDVGTSLNVGRVEGGGAVNVVPAAAWAEIDLRIETTEEAERVDRALRGLTPKLDGTRLTVTGGLNRPPMVKGPRTAELLERARAAASTIEIDLRDGATGGGSDGNFTAALGIPTLDGLGPLGDGAHAAHEQIEIDSLPRRCALLAALVMEL